MEVEAREVRVRVRVRVSLTLSYRQTRGGKPALRRAVSRGGRNAPDCSARKKHPAHEATVEMRRMGRTASAGEALTLFTHTTLSGSGEINPTRVTPCRRQVEYDENCLDDTVRLSMPFASTGRGDPLHDTGPQAGVQYTQRNVRNRAGAGPGT